MSLTVAEFRKRLKDVDHDIRSVALGDAREKCMFEKPDSWVESDMVDAFLPQYISEKDMDCHGEAIRFLEYYIPKLSHKSRKKILQVVKGALNAKVVTSPPELAFSIHDVEVMRQHAVATFKKIVPLLSREETPECQEIVEEILTHVETTFAESLPIKREMYETLQPFLEHNILYRIFRASEQLSKRLYACIKNDKKNTSLEKQLRRTTAALARAAPSAVLNTIIQDALNSSSIGTLSAIAGCARERMTKYLEKTMDVARKITEEQEDDEKQCIDIIMLYKSLVQFTSNKVNPFLDDILGTLVSMTRFNIFEEDDDEEEQEHDEGDEEEEEYYGGLSGDSDGWKVRCSALDYLAECVRSNVLVVKKLLPLLLNTPPTKATLLEKCFRDEEKRVCLKACDLLTVLVQVCSTRYTCSNSSLIQQKPVGQLLSQHQARLLKALISLGAVEVCETISAVVSFLGQECNHLEEVASAAIKLLDRTSGDAPVRLCMTIALVAAEKGDTTALSQLTTVLTKFLTAKLPSGSDSKATGINIILPELCDCLLSLSVQVQNRAEFLSDLMINVMHLSELAVGTNCTKPLQTLATLILKEREMIDAEMITQAYKIFISKLEEDHSFIMASAIFTTTITKIPAPHLPDEIVATVAEIGVKKLYVSNADKDTALRLLCHLFSGRSAAVPASTITPLLNQPITAVNVELVLQLYCHLVKMGHVDKIDSVVIPFVMSFLKECNMLYCNLHIVLGDLFHAIAEKAPKKSLKKLIGMLETGDKKGFAVALGALRGGDIVDQMASQLDNNDNAGQFAVLAIGEAARHCSQTALKCYPLLTQENYNTNEIKNALKLCICTHPAILQETLKKLESSQPTEKFRSLDLLRESLTLAAKTMTSDSNTTNNDVCVFAQKEYLILAVEHLHRVIQNGCADGGVPMGLLARWDFNTVHEHLCLLVKEKEKEACLSAVGSALQTILPLLSRAEQLVEIKPIVFEFISCFKNESADKREMPKAIRRSAVNFINGVLEQCPSLYSEEFHDLVFDTVLQEIAPDPKHIEMKKILANVYERTDPLVDVRKTAVEVAVKVACKNEFRTFVTQEQLEGCITAVVQSCASVITVAGREETSTPRSEDDIEIQQAARSGIEALHAVPVAWEALPAAIASMCKPLEDVITRTNSKKFEKNYSTTNKKNVAKMIIFLEENGDELPAEFNSVAEAAKKYKPVND